MEQKTVFKESFSGNGRGKKKSLESKDLNSTTTCSKKSQQRGPGQIVGLQKEKKKSGFSKEIFNTKYRDAMTAQTVEERMGDPKII